MGIKLLFKHTKCVEKFLFLFLLLGSFFGHSQSIQVNSIVPNPVCAGQTVTVTFTTTNGNGANNRYDSATTFTAYLSSNTGVTPYSLLGTITILPYTFSGGNGTVNSGIQALVTIPVSAIGSYRIAIGSSNPTFNASTGAGASAIFSVNAAPNGGSVTGSTTVCPGTNSTSLALTGYSGSIVKWQSSPLSDFSSGVIDITNTTINYTAVNVNLTTFYRAVLTNGTCTANSLPASVTVNPTAGFVSSNQNICTGTQPANIILTGSTGTIQWQQSNDNVTFTNIVGATGSTLTSGQMGTLTATRYYRASITGGCGTINSSVVAVVVTPQTVGGTVNSDVTVCSGNNSTILTLTGHTGNVVKWQSATQQNFNNAIDIANTATSLTVTNLTVTTYYRAVVQSGNCSQVNSNRAKITVQNAPNGGTLSGSATVCYGTNSTTLTLSGYSNTIQKWQSSPVNDFSSGVVDIANTTATLTVTNLTVTTYYRAVLVNNNGCTANSTIATVTVSPQLNAVIASNNGPICIGSNAVFNLTGSAGATVTYSVNGGGNQMVVLTGGSVTVTITGPVTNQTLALVSISLGSCSRVISGSSTVVVNSTNTWTGAVDNQWSTLGNWSCGQLPTLSTDVVINSGAVQISGVNALASTLIINGTSALSVVSGNNITVTNAVNVASGASFVLQNNANLVQVNNVSNTGNITVNRNSSALMRLDYTLWGSPVASQNLQSFSPLTLSNRFYQYNSATNLYAAISPTNNFALGRGYLIRMPDNHPTTPTIWSGQFTGVPNNGNINLSMANGGAGFGYNAISNPYPSPVSMTSFVNGNAANITGTLYFWRKTNNAATEPGYCTWTTAGFVSNGEAQVVNPNGILRTGQGFIVEMSGASTSLSFTNAMRSTDTANQFFRNANSTSEVINGDRIWLNVSNTSGANNQMLVGYFDTATVGVDFGIDGKAIEDAPVSLNMDIAGTKYIIQGRPTFDATDIVPLSFKTTFAGSHTIAVDHIDGIFAGTQAIYLKDNLLNVLHDIKASDYSFTSTVGTFDSRFEIHYQNVTLSVDEQILAREVLVYKNAEGFLTVESQSENLEAISIYNVEGKQLANKTRIDTDYVMFVNLAATETVILVKVTSQNGVVIQKKVVF